MISKIKIRSMFVDVIHVPYGHFRKVRHLIAQIEKVSLPTSGNTRRPKGKPVMVNTSMALRSIKIRKLNRRIIFFGETYRFRCTEICMV